MVSPVNALRFENLLAWILSLTIFKHEKEGKPAIPTAKFAGPANFLQASSPWLTPGTHVPADT